MSPRRDAGEADSDVDGAARAAEPPTMRAVAGEPRVHDRVALDEIELYAEVLSAVAAADRPLTQQELDEILGYIA